jgi:tetratricopeptide (TPR) repeat protein
MLIAATVAVYAGIVAHNFVNWDDPLHVTANPYVVALTPANLHRIWTAGYQGLYIPVTYTFIALIGQIGLRPTPVMTEANVLTLFNPATFHVASLVLHCINVLLVYALARRVLRREWPAAFAAALFALHPVQVESVAWISEIRGLLGASFALLAVHAYLQFAGWVEKPAAKGWGWFALSTLLFAFSLLSKPSYAALPVVAAVLDHYVARRPWKATVLPCGIWVALVLACIKLTQSAQPLPPDQITPLWQRPFVAGDSIAFYFGKLLWPAHLTVDYGRTPHLVTGHAWGYLTWLVPFALLIIAARAKSRQPLVWAGMVIFAATLLPVSGIVPFGFQSYSTVADRYLYFPLIGAAIAAGALLSVAPPRLSSLCWMMLVVLGNSSLAQQRVWTNSETLFTHAIRENPASPQMHQNLGATYAHYGRLDEALGEYKEALRYDGRSAIAKSNIGLILMARGETALATAHFRAAVADQPGYASAHNDLGTALAAQHMDKEALSEFGKAAAIDPELPEPHRGMANILGLHGQLDNAIIELTTVARLTPSDPVAHYRLGLALEQARRIPEAQEQFRIAAALSPSTDLYRKKAAP